MRILGVDPGSRLTGFGCIDSTGNHIVHIANGTLKLSNTSGKATIPLEERLFSIYTGLSKVICTYKPDVLAVEKVFFAKNAVSALKLGQARGAVILTGMIHSLKIFEYSATEVKLVVVGHGQAGKDRVASAVKLLLRCGDFPTADASDGLALAMCHAYMTKIDWLGVSGGKKKRLSLAESLGVEYAKNKVGEFR